MMFLTKLLRSNFSSYNCLMELSATQLTSAQRRAKSSSPSTKTAYSACMGEPNARKVIPPAVKLSFLVKKSGPVSMTSPILPKSLQEMTVPSSSMTPSVSPTASRI